MKSDNDIKRDVEAELRWSPDVHDTDIAVKVTGGEVSLTGFVPNYLDKYGAAAAVGRVKGVAAVANDLQVKPFLGGPTDPEIARAAITELKLELPLTCEDIRPIVNQGHVTLEGTVEWHYQRERAESAMRRLSGVLGVSNSIRIKPAVAPENIKRRIEDAFKRLAHVDADHITVNAHGSDVTLRGEVRSWAERDEALQTAWAAPGVANVKNELTVRI